MDKKFHSDLLGKIIVNKLRDESYSQYVAAKNYARSISLEEYHNIPKNPNYAPEYQNIDDERFKFLIGLTEGQLTALNKLVLNALDSAAFFFLRELEENLHSDKSVELTIQGKKVTDFNEEFLSGTLFGEYFLWVKKHSKYGSFQH